jgi:uncharacterized protein YciI
MKPDPGRVRVVAPRHAAYWADLALEGYQGGPFADRTGGLITFEAESPTRADALVAADPFARHDLLAQSWIKEWIVDSERRALTPEEQVR